MNNMDEIIVRESNFNTNDINAITTNANNSNNALATYNILSDNIYYKYTGYELIQMFLADKETDKTSNTRESYLVTLTQFFNNVHFFDNVKGVGMNNEEITIDLIKSIERSHVQEFRKKLDTKIKSGLLKPSSANLKLTHMYSFCEWIRNITGLITKNPFYDFKSFHVKESGVGSNSLTLDEVIFIFNECDKQRDIALNEGRNKDKLKWTRNKLMIELSMSLVIRREALIELTFNDFISTVDGMYLCIKFDKTQENDSKIDKDLYDRLVEFYEQDKINRKYDNRYKDCIFGICSDQFNRIVKDLAKRVGIEKKITCHSLKSTMGYIAAEYGDISINKLTKMMHHKNPVTSQMYYDKSIKQGSDIGCKVFNDVVKNGNLGNRNENRINGMIINTDNVDYDKVSDMSELVSGELNTDEIMELIRGLQEKVKGKKVDCNMNNKNDNIISKAI